MTVNNKVIKINRRRSNPNPKTTEGKAVIALMFKTFKEASFKNRLKSLSLVESYLNKDLPEVNDFWTQVRNRLVKTHINLTATEVIQKYNLSGKQITEGDFYHICQAENITVVNRDEEYRAHLRRRPLKAAGIFCISGEPQQYIILNETLKGNAQLKSMFHVLGFYFLHRREHLKPSEAFGKKATARDREAALFSTESLKNTFAESRLPVREKLRVAA